MSDSLFVGPRINGGACRSEKAKAGHQVKILALRPLEPKTSWCSIEPPQHAKRDRVYRPIQLPQSKMRRVQFENLNHRIIC